MYPLLDRKWTEKCGATRIYDPPSGYKARGVTGDMPICREISLMRKRLALGPYGRHVRV